MDKRLNYFVIGSFVVTLILLYVTSSTNWILKPKVEQIYKATLLISDVDSGLWRNYRLGVEAASTKYNVDMAVKTRFQFRADNQEHVEQILTEIEFGAEGLIVATAHFKEISQLLEAENLKETILFTKVDHSFCSESYGNCAYVYYDYYGAGKALGEFLQETHPEKEVIYMITEHTLQKNHEFFLTALKETHSVNFLENATLQTAGVEQIKSALNKNDIIIGLDENSILYFTDVKEVPIYGLGYTNLLIDGVLQGNIDGLVCFDEYMAGYLSVKNLATVLDGGTIESCIEIPYQVMTKETMFENEAFLFPIQ